MNPQRGVSQLWTATAEAMPAGILRGLLRYEIEGLLPAHALRTARIAEQSERAHLEKWADLVAEARA